MVLGLVLNRGLGPGIDFKSSGNDLVRIIISTIGTDLETGQERLTSGITDLSDG